MPELVPEESVGPITASALEGVLQTYAEFRERVVDACDVDEQAGRYAAIGRILTTAIKSMTLATLDGPWTQEEGGS